MTAPRIAPGGLAELGLFNWLFARGAAAAVGADDARIFSTLGRTRGLFRGWLHFAARMMPFGELPRRDTEMVIVRVAHLRACDYELDHHRRLGARAGIDEALFERIREGPDAGFAERERALLEATDELVQGRDLSDARWQALRRHLNEREAIAFVMLVGQYDMLATTIRALGVQRDELG